MEHETVKNFIIKSYLGKLKTYKNWEITYQSPKNLAAAGFYCHINGVVVCNDCNLILTDWDTQDDPFVEHEKNSPDCLFIKTFGQMKTIPNDDDIFRYLCAHSDILKPYIKLNLNSLEHIKRGVCKRLEKDHRFFNNIQEICDYFRNDYKEVSLPSDYHLKICKICLTNEIQQVFLYCGHLIACNECGKRFLFCPICKLIIVKHQPIYIT